MYNMNSIIFLLCIVKLRASKHGGRSSLLTPSLPLSNPPPPPCFYIFLGLFMCHSVSCIPDFPSLCLQEVMNFFLLVQVRGGQLWGTDVYTDDSDLVAGMWFDEKVCSCRLCGS